MTTLAVALAARARHLAPFLVLGDPSAADTEALAVAAVSAGATMLELGLPYGDACADGPVIQRACDRALASGTDVRAAWRTLAAIAAAVPAVPRNLLVYGNLVHARGLDRFVGEAVDAGASSLLVPDVPCDEDEPLRRACAGARLPFVALVGPRTSPARIARTAAGAAFVYATAVQGTTGGDAGGDTDVATLVERVRAATDAPVCVGFGLRTRAHVAAAFAAGARIAVVGSALANVVERTLHESPTARAAAFHAAVAALLPSPEEP